MFRRRVFHAVAVVILSISLLVPLWLRAHPPSKQADSKSERLTSGESRGKIIYTTARSPSGEPFFYRLATGGDYVPATGITCAGCHGLDGKGGRLGDVPAPDITYKALTKPSTAPSGRSRSPYTADALIARAIIEGIDPSGQRLSVMMPRWSLSKSDLRDLLAYLKHLGSK